MEIEDVIYTTGYSLYREQENRNMLKSIEYFLGKVLADQYQQEGLIHSTPFLQSTSSMVPHYGKKIPWNKIFQPDYYRKVGRNIIMISADLGYLRVEIFPENYLFFCEYGTKEFIKKMLRKEGLNFSIIGDLKLISVWR